MWTRLGILRDREEALYFCIVRDHTLAWPLREFKPPASPRWDDLLHLPCFDYNAVVVDPYGKKELMKLLFARAKCDMILSFVRESESTGKVEVVYYQKIFGVEPFEIVTQVTGEGHYHFSVRAIYTSVSALMRPCDEPFTIRELPPQVIVDPNAKVGIRKVESEEEEGEAGEIVDGIEFASHDEKAPEYEENPGKPFRMGDD